MAARASTLVERAHGTRAKYVHDGCRCLACRVANTDYETSRQARVRALEPWTMAYAPEVARYVVRNRDTGEIILRTPDREKARQRRDKLNREASRLSGQTPLWASPTLEIRVQRHLGKLQALGVGLHQVAKLTGMSRHRLIEIARGEGLHKDRPKDRRLKFETAQRILEVEPIAADGAYVDATETWRLLNELIESGMRRYEIAQALGRKMPNLQIGKRKVRQSTEYEVRKLHNALYRSSAALRAVCRCEECSR